MTISAALAASTRRTGCERQTSARADKSATRPLGWVAAVGTVKVGTDADDDGYLQAFTFGASNAPATADRGDFNGALNGDTAECPHIAKGTVLKITVAHNSMIHPDLALTFLEG